MIFFFAMMQYCHRGQAKQKSRNSVPHVSEYQEGKGLCSRKIVITRISTDFGNNVHSESSPCILTHLPPSFAALDGEFWQFNRTVRTLTCSRS